MIRNCRQCEVSFEITEDDLKFYEKVSPVFQGKKYVIPPPTLCSHCRAQRKMSFRNERFLYERKCDLTGKNIISVYSPDKPFIVYHHKEWMSDKWDPLQYGQFFSFSKSFFEQFYALFLTIPKRGLYIDDTMENCDYCNYGRAAKDCYLCVGPLMSEKCRYSWSPAWGTEDNDGYCNIQCQYCYECLHCTNCYEVFFSCFSKKEYIARVKEILSSYKKMKLFSKQFEKFILQFPHKYARNINAESCTGDVIQNCKNCYECYNVFQMENGKFCDASGEKSFDMYDCYQAGMGAVQCYESIGSIGGNKSIFSIYVRNNINCYYCISCDSCTDCFGCEALKHKQYCILNKQYTKEEYEKLVPKIIEHMIKTGEWGEFFPAHLSPFGYNETVANEYYPLTREQVLGISDASNPVGNRHAYSLQHGQIFNWSDYEPPKPDVKKIIPSSKLPDDITKIPDDILNWAIECEVTKKPFRIIKQELEFYRQHNLPIPRRHPDQRHKDRLQLRNPRKLWTRQCDCRNPEHQHTVETPRRGFSTDTNDIHRCKNIFKTTYSPDRKEIVYCEECYLKEVY